MLKKVTLPYGYRLMASYLLLVLAPIAVLGYFSYTSSVRAVKEQATSSIRGTLQQIKDNLLYKIQNFTRVSDQLYFDQNLQSALRRNEGGWYNYETTINYVLPVLQNAINLTGSDIRLSLYLQNNQIPEIYDVIPDHMDPLSKLKGYDLFHLKRLEAIPWYREWTLNDNYSGKAPIKWRRVGTDERYRNISLLRDLNDLQQFEKIGFMRIIIKRDDLFEAVDFTKIGEGSSIIVYDENDEPLFASGMASSQEATGWVERNSRSYLQIKEALPELNWHVVAYLPNKLLEANANKVRELTILLCVASFITLALLSLLVSRYFSKRVRKIITSLNAIREGNFYNRINFTGNDEFAQIATAFNAMSKEINDLINEVYLTKIRQKEAELESLQAQINPHFLYNTLSSINRLGQFGDIEKMNSMILGLARFYRLALNEGNTIILIEKELQHVKTYLEIQQIKYGDQVEVVYQIDSEVLNYHTVKLILQPFVENVLEHAWNGEHVRITLIAFREVDQIVFIVEDDGIGIPPETIAQIFNKNGVKVGYGIRNVDERIKLQFGESFGISITSEPNLGTKVMIVVPCLV